MQEQGATLPRRLRKDRAQYRKSLTFNWKKTNHLESEVALQFSTLGPDTSINPNLNAQILDMIYGSDGRSQNPRTRIQKGETTQHCPGAPAGAMPQDGSDGSPVASL